MALLFDDRSRRFHGMPDHRRQLDSGLAQLHRATRDARDVQQIVDQSHHLLRLALHRRPHFFDQRGIVARDPHEFQAGSNRRERIAELVGQNRQKLVLTLIGFPQRFLGIVAAGDVDRHAADQGGRTFRSGMGNLLTKNGATRRRGVSTSRWFDTRFAGRRAAVVLDELRRGVGGEHVVVRLADQVVRR